MQTRFQIGTPVISNKFLYITDSNSELRPGDRGTVVKVAGGLLVKFDGLPDAIGVFAADVAAR